jgi:regulatory protein
MREHSRAELKAKLAVHATPTDDLDALLDELSAQGWLSDERAALSLVRSKAQQWGSRRLKQALQNKGVGAEVITEAMSGLADTEVHRAAHLWQRKFGSPPADATERARQMRFLLARGFSSATVTLTLKKAASIACGEWPEDADAITGG